MANRCTRQSERNLFQSDKLDFRDEGPDSESWHPVLLAPWYQAPGTWNLLPGLWFHQPAPRTRIPRHDGVTALRKTSDPDASWNCCYSHAPCLFPRKSPVVT